MAAGVVARREGGVAAIVYNLGRELESRGHRVTYQFYDDLLGASERADRFCDARFAVRLARYIRKNRSRFSVVNLHAPCGFAYGMLRALRRSTNYPPYVMTLHGLEERRVHAMSREARKGKVWHFSLKNRLWERVYHQPRFTLAIRTADLAHCYSRDVWTMLQLKYNLDSDKVAYIPNGVEERFFTKREYADRKPVRLLYAGTWLDQRGVFYLRDALASLNCKFQDWTFTVAGPGIRPEEVKSFFAGAIQKQVIVLPVVPADRMPALYAEHDVFVFPSLMEGQPSVLLEAMAGGMAVITTETCGMVDVVEDDLNGLLIPPADAAALEQSLLRVCQSAELRRQLGSAARETLRRRTWQKSAFRFDQLLKSALNLAPSPDTGR